jgi:hypothetical protein
LHVPGDPFKTLVRLSHVEFVGTNVAMTYQVPAGDITERDLAERFEANLALHAITDKGVRDGTQTFIVMASPLERLFHKIGPPIALTVIKHASTTLDLSDVNARRQAQALLNDELTLKEHHPTHGTVWKPWDAGKLIATFMRYPQDGDASVIVGGHAFDGRTFPHALLAAADALHNEAGGLPVDLPEGARAHLAEVASGT